MNVCAVIAVAMVWSSFVLQGFWALWENITVAMVMLVREACYLHVLQ
jgi:hypothetical protein